MNAAVRQPVVEPVAVTGVGLLSALGVGAAEWLAAAMEGEPACRPVDDMPTLPPGSRAARMPDFDVAPLLESRKAYLDRHTVLLLGAAALALRAAGWHRDALPRARAGLMAGASWGGIGTATIYFQDVLTKGPKFAKPILFPHTYANTAAAMAAIEWALQGPHEAYAGGALASAQALVAALDTVRRGEADVLLAGGAEALPPAVMLALHGAGHLPEAIPGEGGAILVLEPFGKARARAAAVRTLIAGAGLAGTAPDGGGLAAAIGAALHEAGLPPEAIGAVFSGAAAPFGNAPPEAPALAAVFGARLPPVTALAGLQGDLLGAAAAVNVAAAALLLDAGWLPGVPGAAASAAGASGWVRAPRHALAACRHALVLACEEGCGAAAFVVSRAEEDCR